MSTIGRLVRERSRGRSSQVSDGRLKTSRNVSTAARGSGAVRLWRVSPGWLRRHRQQGARPRPGWDAGASSARRAADARDALGDEPPEDGVRRVLGDALAAGERQVPEVEVAWTPAEVCRVERDDEGVAAARLGPRDEALDEVVVAAPVELVPVPRATQGAGDLLHRHRGLGAEDLGDALLAGAPRDGEVGLVVCHRQHADRCDEEGALVPAAEELDGRVALGRVDEHPWHDPPPGERRHVGLGARLGAGRACDVGESALGHDLAGRRLELRAVRGHCRSAAEGARPVDGGLDGPADALRRHTCSSGRAKPVRGGAVGCCAHPATGGPGITR